MFYPPSPEVRGEPCIFYTRSFARANCIQHQGSVYVRLLVPRRNIPQQRLAQRMSASLLDCSYQNEAFPPQRVSAGCSGVTEKSTRSGVLVRLVQMLVESHKKARVYWF